MEIEASQSTLENKRQLAAKYLLQSRKIIKSQWQKKVIEEIDELNETKTPTMANSLEIFIDEIATILKREPPGPEKISDEARAKIYGREKGLQKDYSLSSLLREFGVVREIITNELEKAGLLVSEVRNPINKAIDHAMSLAATEFEKSQQFQLRATLTRTEVSNKDLEQFAMIAAHDLNSPLATVTSLLDLLKDSLPGDSVPEIKEYIDFMEQTLVRMRNLVVSLLEYAQVARAQPHFQQISMKDALGDSLQNLRAVIEETNTKVSYDDLPEVFGDRVLLSQVLQNLISNSIKYRGTEPPKIEFSYKEDSQDCWQFALKDNGIGFKIQDSEEIFSLYKRLQEKSDKPGAGIGLATCRRLIGLHGGKIWATSEPGKGSTFFFTLPKN